MHALWYAIIAGMLCIYVVLDGFDFGAGILHLFVAKTDLQRREVLAAIGPYWNGNEVWLVASGGLLVFAFPRVYAAGFSGFYLPMMTVLWLLVWRGISIEFRSKLANPLWRAYWDAGFWCSSLCMAVVLGTALGNVIRGVPLGAEGYFDGALFTNFQPGINPGVLDWYTLSVGVFAALVLAGHGALFLNWKTSGDVAGRAAVAAGYLWPAILASGVFVTYLTSMIRPQIYMSLIARPWTWLFAVLIGGALVGVFVSLSQKRELAGFLSSTLFVLSLLFATAAGMFPNMLVSTINSSFTITADNAAIGDTGLAIGLYWWAPTVVLAILYFSNLFRTFRGKTSADAYGH